MFAGNFAPAGWMFCNGATLPISENETLFNLIGTTYGGDGQETFNLPNLQGRAPLHAGTGKSGVTYQLGETAGTETVTLTTQQIPIHNHAVLASTGPGSLNLPTDNITAASAAVKIYLQDSGTANFGNVVSPVGGSQPHENMQQYLCISFIISLFGVFPRPG